MEFGQKKVHEIDLFDFTSYFGLDFFKFSGKNNGGLIGVRETEFKKNNL